MKQINVILGGKNYKNKGIFFPENNSLKLLKGACIRKTGGSTYKEGHRDRYIGSLFRAGELVNMIPS